MIRRLLIAVLFALLAASSTAQTVPAATEGRPFTRSDNLVATYVFEWFTATNGQLYSVWHPREGRVEWDGSEAFWKRQLKDMMDANIDLIYVHLTNDFPTQRINLYRALRDLRMQGYQVPQIAPWLDPAIAFHPSNLGPIDLCEPTDRDLFIEQYVAFYQTYLLIDAGGEAFLASMDGKPMLSTWALADDVRNPSCLTRRIFESELYSRLGSAFVDGVYYASLPLPVGFEWADEHYRAFVGYTAGHTLIDGQVSVLKPGMWDRRGNFLARNGGVGYAAGWDELIANSGLRQVQVVSWNEYTEGTGIYEADPTTAYWTDHPDFCFQPGLCLQPDSWGPSARYFIDLTAEKGAQFNNVPELDAVVLSASPMPAAVALGEVLRLQVGVRNTGDEQWRGDTGFALSLDWGNGFGDAFVIDDGQHEINQRTDPLFAGKGGYDGVFRGRSIVLGGRVTAPTLSGLYRPRWRMSKNGVVFGGQLEQIVQVGEADACATAYAPTTVHATLGIAAYGTNYFCGDLGDPGRTANFICTELGHNGASDFSISAKPPGSYCAHKTAVGTPNHGLVGNWGHGTQILSQVHCSSASCGTSLFPTTVHGTLGIAAYGSNCFAGDLGDPLHTANFICAEKGYARSNGYRTGPKTASTHCAYKTRNDRPNYGLLGNFGHGLEQLTEVRCVSGP